MSNLAIDLQNKMAEKEALEQDWQMMETFMKAIRHPVFAQDETYQEAILVMVSKMYAHYKEKKAQFQASWKVTTIFNTMHELIWKILNKVLKCNFYNNHMKPKFIPFKLWNSLRVLYRNQVEIPYLNNNKEQIKKDLLDNPKLAKFSKFFDN